MTEPQPLPGAQAARPFFLRHIWVIAALVGVASLTILRSCDRPTLRALAELGPAPSFTLTDQQGKPFSSSSLAGKPWIASFFFTSCKTVCPAIGRANQEVLKHLEGADVHLVSFSVDPEFDTPAAMTTWGAQFGADPARWHLLTGPRNEIEAIATGFASHMGTREEKGGIVDIAHSMRLILVAPNGQVLYHFRIDDPNELGLIDDYARYLEAEHRKQQGGSR